MQASLGSPSAVPDLFFATIGNPRSLSLAIAVLELWYGVAKSSRPEFNAARLATFLAGPALSLPFADEDAQAAGRV